jgi:peroxiredoxin
MGAAKQMRMLEAGQPAPGFELADLGGAVRALPQILAQGPALLAFFKVSCPTCQLTLPFLERIWKGRRDSTPQMIAISQDDERSTREFHKQFGITFPTLLDREEKNYPASNAFQISHVPSLFLVEPGGRISWTLEGFGRKEIAALGDKFGVAPFREEEYVPEWKSG